MNKKRLIIIVILLCSITTGCYNYHELSDMAIITGVGIDKVNDKFKISMLIANTTDSISSKDAASKATIITGVGNNITEALDDVRAKSSKDIYIGHISLVLVSEEIAKKNIYDVIDPTFRNPESIKKINLVIVRNSSSNDVLRTLSPLDMYPSQNIIFNIKNSVSTVGISYNTYMSDFIYRMINYGIDNIVPSISLKGNTNDDNSIDQLKEIETMKYIKIDDLALFKGTKLIGYASLDESKMINIIDNKSTSLSITTNCYKDLNKNIVIKIDDPKTKIDYTMDNNNIKFNFNIKASGSINETNCKLKLDDKDVIKKIEEYTRSEIFEKVNNVIKKVKSYETDIFGLGNMIYKKDYKYWLSIKDNWDNIYSNIKYSIKIDFNLDEKGALENTIKEEIK